jgi:hypothetical protein
MIRCLAVLRAMGSDPAVPSLGYDPIRDCTDDEEALPAKARKAPGMALPILLTVIWLAIFCASVFAR